MGEDTHSSSCGEKICLWIKKICGLTHCKYCIGLESQRLLDCKRSYCCRISCWFYFWMSSTQIKVELWTMHTVLQLHRKYNLELYVVVIYFFSGARYVKCRAQRCTEGNRVYLFPGHVDTNSLVVQDEYVFTQVCPVMDYFSSFFPERLHSVSVKFEILVLLFGSFVHRVHSSPSEPT